MKENRGKIKSILVVLTMLLAAFTVGIVMFGSVSAGAPGTFVISTPTNGSTVTGIYNITWTEAAGAQWYNVSVDGTVIANVTNASRTTYYCHWNSFFDRYNYALHHSHNITITACNGTDRANETYRYVHVTVKGTPGVDIWEYANGTILNTNTISDTHGEDIINTSTDLIYYGQTFGTTGAGTGIKVNNASGWAYDREYYLYYPIYTGGRYQNNRHYALTWGMYGDGATLPPHIQPYATNPDFYFGDGNEMDIALNRSGLWVIAPENWESTINVSTSALMNSTVAVWLWVNGSQSYTLQTNDINFGLDSFDYDGTGTISFTVDGAGDTHAMVAVRYDYDNKIYGHGWNGENDQLTGGVSTIGKNTTSFPYAGNYTAMAYWDLDGLNEGGTQIYYYEGNASKIYYNRSLYGHDIYTPYIGTSSEATAQYDYTWCGPWDPPEYNASQQLIQVSPGSPAIVLNNGTSANQHYGRRGIIHINVTDSSGTGITNLDWAIKVLNETGDYAGAFGPGGTGAGYLANKSNITQRHDDQGGSGNPAGNYTLTATWVNGSVGTWAIAIGNSTGGDRTEEWNGSAEFQVISAPGLYIDITNDGDGDDDLVVNAGPAGPPETNGGIREIHFAVLNGTNTYYGAQGSGTGQEEFAKENITVSGDALLLSSKTLKELDDMGSGIVELVGNTWILNIVPIMDTAANGGGEITISATWAGHGGTAVPQTIQFGGTQYNGSLVSISPSEITIDQNTTVTVTVTDPSSPTYGYVNANVSLWYINNSGYLNYRFNMTDTANNYDGEYLFGFNQTQQTTNQTSVNDWTYYKANRYIAAYASIGGGKYGYAYAKLIPQRNFKVTAEFIDGNTGDGTSTIMAGRDYNRLWFNVSVVDANGNVTSYPITGTGQDKMKIRIFDVDGVDVTDNITASFSSSTLDVTTINTANYSHSGSNHYIVTPGTYTVYAWNNTYDSTGNNGTIVVQAVDVACDYSEFIWQYDDNISATFTCTYQGDSINGTLRIDNITNDPATYNKTWANCSFDGTSTDDGGNTSITLTAGIGFTNGVGTVSNITANFLPTGVAHRNITFWFKSDKSSSQYARCSGVVPVKIPDIAPSPASIPWNEPAELEITVTGRGTPLEDIRVNITVPGLTALPGSDTNFEGKVIFAFTPASTGNVVIQIENRTSDTKVPVTSWSLYLDAPSQTNENESFTVTVRNATVTGAVVADATVTFYGNIYNTGTDGTATIPATGVPTVTANDGFPMTATKTGHAEDSATITVLNVPKLSVVAPSTATTGSTFQVVIADEPGNAIIGATVTIDGTTYTSGANGIATLTAPSTAGTYTIIASKTGFITSDPETITVEEKGIPGFELLALIAAIGVAFILLRRRRH